MRAFDAEAAREGLQQSIIERFGEEEGIGALDETGIPKKGKASVGVAKQHCSAVGKLENCQVATLLTSSTSAGHVFFDRRLFARRLVPECQAACACEGSRSGQLSDETRTSERGAGAGLAAGSARFLKCR